MHGRIQILLTVKGFFEECCITLSVIVDDMGIYVGDHIDLGMSGITLHCLNITTVKLQLVSNRGVTETVEYNRWQIMLLDQIIPGVTSFCAAAARLNVPVCEGSEQVMIVPVAAGDAAAALDVPGVKVFMKSGREAIALRDKLAARGELDRASMVANCGLPDEKIFPQMADIDDEGDYFTVVIVKEG